MNEIARHEEDPEPDLGMLIRMLGSVGGVVVTSPINGLAGQMAAAAAQVVLSEVPLRLFQKNRERAVRNLDKTLAYSAEEEGFTEEALVSAIEENPRLVSVLCEALSGAATTTLEWKLKLLGRLVAEGVLGRDAAKLEVTAMFVNAARDLELPHLEVLELLTTIDYGNGESMRTLEMSMGSQPLISTQTMMRKLDRYGVGLLPVLSTLERHGLISIPQPDFTKAFQNIGYLVKATRDDQRRALTPTMPDTGWRITEFGIEFLVYLEKIGAPEDT